MVHPELASSTRHAFDIGGVLLHRLTVRLTSISRLTHTCTSVHTGAVHTFRACCAPSALHVCVTACSIKPRMHFTVPALKLSLGHLQIPLLHVSPGGWLRRRRRRVGSPCATARSASSLQAVGAPS